MAARAGSAMVPGVAHCNDGLKNRDETYAEAIVELPRLVPESMDLMAETHAERAYELLKQRIVRTQMKPGAVIDEVALVQELGLGRTPIREACKRLETERLVVVLPRRGMYVSEVTLGELRELEEVRLELEALSARLAVQRMTPARLQQMHRLLAAQRRHRSRPDENHQDLLDLDRQLHGLVWEANHNSLLAAECMRLFDLSMRMWYLLIDRLDPSDLHEEVFDEIFVAAETKDERRADAAIRRHILLFGEAIRRHL